MAYAQLYGNPFPHLTIAGRTGMGCHSCRAGMGDDSDLPLPTDIGSDIDPTDDISPIIFTDPIGIGVDSNLPLPTDVGGTLMSDYPESIGTNFTLVGPNEYLNEQTGQIVPMQTAQLVSGVNVGPGTANLTTTDSNAGLVLTDPTTGTTYSGLLSPAAQALQAAGQLVTVGGLLTAQGQALARAGGLNSIAPTTAISSTSLAGLSAWLSAQTLMSGVPNGVSLVGGIAILVVASSALSGGKRRR